MKYKNNPCPVCNEIFKTGDDIVVCPECGTPHHRACWQNIGECVNTGSHGTGFVWKSIIKEEEKNIKKQEHPLICPDCGNENHPKSTICEYCGHYFDRKKSDNHTEEVYRAGPLSVQRVHFDDLKIDNIPAVEVADYIGQSAPIYLARFVKMDQHKTKTSWNWTAAFLGPIWCFYRGLNKIGLILCAMLLLTYFVAFTSADLKYYDTVFRLSQEVVAGEISRDELVDEMTIAAEEYNKNAKLSYVRTALSSGISIAGMVITGLFGNCFYRKKIHSDIMKARQEANDMPTYQYLIRKKGKGKIFAVIPYLLFASVAQILVYFIMSFFMQL